MAPENEGTKITPAIELIASLPIKSEVKSWERKVVALAKLLDQLKPVDEAILTILAERQPMINELEELRHQMTQECIHPVEHLVDKGSFVLCKFCDRKLVVPSTDENS